MSNNPIIDEIHRIREQLLAEHNGDLRSLFNAMKERTEAAARAGKPVYAPPHRPLEPRSDVKKAG
jgi:hypothetical protein